MARSRFRVLRLGPPCLLLAAPLLAGGETHAATRVVGNCNDSGAGSLRSAIAAAFSGDTIDVSRLTCSWITLAGTIAIPQASLAIVGSSRYALTIDGNRKGRVFDHTGTGLLRIQQVSIANGRTASDVPEGGCIQSRGDVELSHARVHHCTALYTGALDPRVAGGGVFAWRDVRLLFTAVFYNSVPEGPGGGVAAGEHVLAYRSQVYGNTATEGGGIWAQSAQVVYSLVHGNHGGFGAGIEISGSTSADETSKLEINKSTISANVSHSVGGGLHTGGRVETVIVDSSIVDNIADSFAAASFSFTTRIFNSTLAYNRNDTNSQCNGAMNTPRGLRLVSTIVSGNTCSLGDDRDIWGLTTDVQGDHNLIGRANVPVPADTIAATDPRLAPLAENGGPTRTRLPLADSPALQRGANPLGRAYDQRGPGFPRVRGGLVDIGAVER